MAKPKVVVAAEMKLEGAPALTVNWKACIVCQKEGGEFNCPANNPNESQRDKGYASLGRNLDQLRSLQYKLPSGYVVDLLATEGDIASSLSVHEAQWHKKCARPFQGEKFKSLLRQARERYAAPTIAPAKETEEPQTQRQTRAYLPLINVKASVCFLCKSSEDTAA